MTSKFTEEELEYLEENITLTRDGGFIVIDDVNCDVAGSIRGDVCGDIEGNVRGDIDGDVDGCVGGDVLGSVQGDVYGNVGKVHGKILNQE